MCIHMYERHIEYESHVIGFHEILGIREIEWEKVKREKNCDKIPKFKNSNCENWRNGDIFQKIKLKKIVLHSKLLLIIVWICFRKKYKMTQCP